MQTRNGAAALREHGGRVDAAAQLYPAAPRPWLDLSTGINPHRYPVPSVPPIAHHRLPLASEIADLVAAAAHAYGRPAGTRLVPVPGSEVAIRLLPLALAATRSRVVVLGPTYGTHAAAWRGAGARVVIRDTRPDPQARDAEIVVLVNPNNPDGRSFPREELLDFAMRWTATGRMLVVDEAFADVTPETSLLAATELPRGVVVLRSLGKFYGLAGLRVGFVGTNEADADAWHRLLGDWPVGGAACVIASAALRDDAWASAMRERLAAGRARLEETLRRRGFTIVGATDLFVLADAPGDVDLVDLFARDGILVRGFAESRRRHRFGLPGDEDAWRRFERACARLR